MKTELAGITRANEGLQGISWNILGQTYVPKNVTEHSFSWHATFPPGTFVPPHIHPDQDEYLYILEGKLDFMLGGADAQATPGDLVRLRDGRAARHFQQIRSERKGAVLGLAEPQALRSVLGHSQYERADTRRGRGARRRAQRPLPAAASGDVSAELSCPAEARHPGLRGFSIL